MRHSRAAPPRAAAAAASNATVAAASSSSRSVAHVPIRLASLPTPPRPAPRAFPCLPATDLCVPQAGGGGRVQRVCCPAGSHGAHLCTHCAAGGLRCGSGHAGWHAAHVRVFGRGGGGGGGGGGVWHTRVWWWGHYPRAPPPLAGRRSLAAPTSRRRLLRCCLAARASACPTAPTAAATSTCCCWVRYRQRRHAWPGLAAFAAFG